MSDGGRRRFRLAVGLALLLAVLALWSQRRTLVEQGLRHVAAGRGVDELEFAIDRLDFGGLSLRRLAIGSPPELSASLIEIAFTPAGLLRGELELLRIDGLRVRAALKGARLESRLLESLRRAQREDAAVAGEPERKDSSIAPLPLFAAFLQPPIARLSLHDVRLQIETTSGQLEVMIELDRRRTGSRGAKATGDVRIQHPLIHGRATLDALASEVEATGGFALRLEGTNLAHETLSAQRALLDLRAEWRADERRAELQIEECATLELAGLAVADRLALRRPTGLCITGGADLAIGRRGDGVAPREATRLDVDLVLAPAELSALVGGGDTALRVDAELPKLSLHVETDVALEDYRVVLQSSGGRITVPLYEVEVRGLGLRGSLPRGEVHLQQILSSKEGADLPILALSGEFALDPSQEAKRLDFSLLLNDPLKIVRLHLRGSHEIQSATGRAQLELEPIHFTPDGPQPADVIPSMAGIATLTAGSLELSGALQWDSQSGLEGHADIGLRALNIESQAASFERVSGDIHLLGPFPPSTASGQRLTIGRLDAGAELSDGVVAWRLHPDGSVDLESMKWGFAGGTLMGSGRYSPLDEQVELLLELGSAEMEGLLELVALDGLTGTGRVTGKLPLRYHDGRLQILSGTLATDRVDRFGGWIRYRPASGAALARGGKQMSMLLDILKNFHYQELAVDLHGDALESVLVGIHLDGSNPDYQSGQPVQFNLNVEAALTDLLQGAAIASRLPDVVSEKLQRQVDGRVGGR